ncbi:hypothetical protein [Streptomyces lunaelactis]|uniref:hypothetical protein n=1 Tax=Streptomyces lunaelactis TaxID=1535768 RepID=UPI001585781F|nr:hypothetical protein [Streptomyces lunaelactis]NUK21945.1 hypothetical protein [Streptomyces lunaelactis]
MKSTRIERRAQKLQLATGLPWNESLNRVKSLAPTDPLIPTAHEQQSELECYFLYQMAWPGIDTRNPWGIRSADSHWDSLLLAVEDEDVNREVPGESMASELVRACLPRIADGGELKGIPGLRFTVESDSVRLYRIGLPGSVTLAGVNIDEWFMALDAESRDAESAGTFQCHQKAPHRWHSSESATRNPATQDMYARHHRRIVSSAWLASGLLRRAPLLRTIGVPLNTTAWTNLAGDGGREWIIEYIHEPRVEAPLHHQGFLNLLTDPECGMPLVTTDLDCSCQLPADAGYACRFYACGTTGSPGELQVRFSRRLGKRLEHYTEDQSDYKARRRLYQRLPECLMRGA